MDRKIKLIWDFRGPNASHTAEHYLIHLGEAQAGQEARDMGVQQINSMHSLVFMIVPESEMRAVRDRLKPHRGEVAEP